MQVAVIEFARNCAKLPEAHSSEFVKATSTPVVGLITEWIDKNGKVEALHEDSDSGGTIRLGPHTESL